MSEYVRDQSNDTICRMSDNDLYERGNALFHSGNYEAAYHCYEECLRVNAQHCGALNNLGVVLAELGHTQAAIAAYERCLRIDPTYVDALYNLGNAHRQALDFERAIATYRQALAYQPAVGRVYTNLGVSLLYAGKIEESLASFRQATQLQPDSALAWNGWGLTLMNNGQFVDAMHACERAVTLDPTLAEAHYNLGLLRLLLGDFGGGWQEYEYRWRLPEHPPRLFDVPPFNIPMWDGSNLSGKRIFLHAEQGLGDTLQFIRLVKRLKEVACDPSHPCEVYVEGPAALRRLLSDGPSHASLGIDHWIDRGSASSNRDLFSQIDCHCSLLSLGRYLLPNVAAIPGRNPYLFPEPELVAKWQQELRPYSGKKVGIAWQGSRGYRWDRFRSIDLTQFAALAAVPDVVLISLQKSTDASGVPAEIASQSFSVVELGSRLDLGGDAFIDTAAVIANLDLVISADTAIGHLAGALGKPVWFALPIGTDWRWLSPESGMVAADRTPWYPTARLFRQPRFGDWPAVFAEMADRLRDRYTHRYMSAAELVS